MTDARTQAEDALATFDKLGLMPEYAAEHGVAEALRVLLAEYERRTPNPNHTDRSQ